MNYYPPFLQRIINSSNLSNANQHLPHLGVQKGGQSTRCYFIEQLLHHSNLYIVDETFRQGQKEKQTKPNPTLGFLSLFRVFPLQTATSPDEGPKSIAADRRQALLCELAQSFMLCLGLCLPNSVLILPKKPSLSRLA